MDETGVAFEDCGMGSAPSQAWRRRRVFGTAVKGTTGLPPHVYFLVSAVFHYLGPAFAVLLFARVDVLGVAWLRIASAAAVFALWRRPWRLFLRLSWSDRSTLVALGVVLGLMNACFMSPSRSCPSARSGPSNSPAR
jgi:threonine/homoserine efflux transporter RhtA